MLTIKQWAEKNGYKPGTVSKWIHSNRLPDVKKVPSNKTSVGYVYMIPRDAQAPQPSSGAGRKRHKYGVLEVAPKPEIKQPLTKRQIRKFIREHCGCMTYRELSQALNMPVQQIRVEYEYLHARYKV